MEHFCKNSYLTYMLRKKLFLSRGKKCTKWMIPLKIHFYIKYFSTFSKMFLPPSLWLALFYITAQKRKFFINDFFSKCHQIRGKLRIWSHLLKKSLTKNFTEQWGIQSKPQRMLTDLSKASDCLPHTFYCYLFIFFIGLNLRV